MHSLLTDDEHMLIVGERINTSRKVKGEPVVEQAVLGRDAAFIEKLATKQAAAGAHYIDVNAGTLTEGEPEALQWITQKVQECVSTPICFDTPNPAALEQALSVHNDQWGVPMINSITAERKRFAEILPLVIQSSGKVVALAMDDSGIQPDPKVRFDVASRLIGDLTDAGVSPEFIYLDPMTFPIGAGDDVGIAMLEILEKVKSAHPGVNTIAGLSNVSHGMPARKFLNAAMTVLCMGRRLDAAILDPQDRMLMGLIAAGEALLGRDEYCGDYIARARAGAFEGL
jgi:5-methyltetrahydrofolate--homocysteine methyltransferase